MNKTTILVLDDEPFIRLNLAAFLEDDGYRVLEAASAEQALSLLEQNEVALAIVDLRLPGIDGASFIRYARLQDANLQFVIHTGSLEFCMEESLLKLGLSTADIFCKPIKDMVRLSELISERLTPRIQFA